MPAKEAQAHEIVDVIAVKYKILRIPLHNFNFIFLY
jgi:hypothetical protein